MVSIHRPVMTERMLIFIQPSYPYVPPFHSLMQISSSVIHLIYIIVVLNINVWYRRAVQIRVWGIVRHANISVATTLLVVLISRVIWIVRCMPCRLRRVRMRYVFEINGLLTTCVCWICDWVVRFLILAKAVVDYWAINKRDPETQAVRSSQ